MQEEASKNILLITGETLGRGDDGLGTLLMANFIANLTIHNQTPKTIVLMNSGVKLVAEGSEYIDELTSLENEGCLILSCGTCIDHYKLRDKLKVGEITNMRTLIQLLEEATKVVVM